MDDTFYKDTHEYRASIEVTAQMNNTSVLKTREQVYLNEMLTDWSKKCWFTQCKHIIKQYGIIFVC